MNKHSDFWIRKAFRASWFYRFQYGVRQQKCTACSGSGYYDHNGSPDCGACNGTGKEDFDGPKRENKHGLVLFEEQAPELFAIYTEIRGTKS